MTKKEYLTAIKNTLSKSAGNDKLILFLNKELRNLTKHSEEVAALAREHGAMTDELTKNIESYLATGKTYASEDLVALIGGTPAQVSYRCNEMARNGQIDKFTIYRDKRKLVAYRKK